MNTWVRKKIAYYLPFLWLSGRNGSSYSRLYFIYLSVDPLLIVSEYLPYGDLLGYLRKSRGHSDNYNTGEKKPASKLTAKDLLSFAWMIADGMEYLATMKVRLNDVFSNFTACTKYYWMACKVYGAASCDVCKFSCLIWKNCKSESVVVKRCVLRRVILWGWYRLVWLIYMH